MSEMILALDAVEPDPEQVRRDFPNTEIEARAKSIRKFGQLYPVLVRPGEGERWIIVDGEMRWRAMRLLHKREPEARQFSTIRAVAQKGAHVEGDGRLAIQLAANDQRTELTPYERVAAVSKLRKVHGRSELQEALGVTDGQMRLLREIADAPDYVWKYGATRRYPKRGKASASGPGKVARGTVTCEPLGVTHLRDVAELAKKLRTYDEEQQRVTDQRHTPVAEREVRRLAERAQRDGWSVSQLRSRCASVKTRYFPPPEGESKESSSSSEPVFSQTPTRLSVSLDRIQEISPDDRAALATTLRKLLETLDEQPS